MRFQMSLSDRMANALNEEQEERLLGTVQETMRSIIADYFVIKRMQTANQPRKQVSTHKKKEEKIEITRNPLIV